MSARDTHRTLTHLSGACDVVFGAICILLSGLATWRWCAGAATGRLVIALWGLSAFNFAWSAITHGRNRVRADLLRGLGSFPLTLYIYTAERDGVFAHLWIPALMASLGACLSVSIGSRNLVRAAVIALSYATGVVAVGGFEINAAHDALALLLADAIVSIVAVNLGRTLVESAKMEAELAQAQKLESVGRLAAGIAHEINTPVQFVGDSLQFVREAVDDLLAVAHGGAAGDDVDLAYLTGAVPEALERAGDGLRRVTRIVRSMRVFAHPASDAIAASDLNASIDATLIVARNEYKYIAELVTDFEPTLPPVACFLSELNQAVLNIVVNAAHAIGDVVAGSTARGTIEVRTRRRGDDVEISIRDTGFGIPEAIRNRVFDPFFTTKEVGKGTGQGLSLAHAIVVEKHRGKLWFVSELGSGTTFFIRIPIAPGVAAG